MSYYKIFSEICFDKTNLPLYIEERKISKIAPLLICNYVVAKFWETSDSLMQDKNFPKSKDFENFDT